MASHAALPRAMVPRARRIITAHWDHFRARSEERWSGWVPTMGKNRLLGRVDSVQSGEHVDERHADGGPPFGRLGIPVQFFTGISTDLFGKQLSEALVASKVGLEAIELVEKLRREERVRHARERITVADQHVVEG